MPNSNPITLRNIQDYATRYFPDEFAKLPPVEKLQWGSVLKTRTRTQWSFKFAPFKLHIGLNKRGGVIWAHQSLDRFNDVYYQLCELDPTLTLACPSPGVDLCPPFKPASRTGEILYREGVQKRGYELRALIQYYFMLKGAIPDVEYPWALGSFEWAVKSVANGAPLNDIPVAQFGHDAAERLLSVRSMIPYEQQTPATTPRTFNHRSQDTVPKEEQKRATEDHSISRIEEKDKEKHGTHHTDQMKKLFKDQSAARKKVDEFLALTSAEKQTHVARIHQLEAQLSEEQVARTDAERARTALHERNKLLQGRLDKTFIDNAEEREKLKNEISDVRLSKQRVRAELNRRIESEKKRKEACASTEAKLQKARAFYTNQKELLEIQVADCTDEKKEAIMKTFEQEYGELGVE